MVGTTVLDSLNHSLLYRLSLYEIDHLIQFQVVALDMRMFDSDGAIRMFLQLNLKLYTKSLKKVCPTLHFTDFVTFLIFASQKAPLNLAETSVPTVR